MGSSFFCLLAAGTSLANGYWPPVKPIRMTFRKSQLPAASIVEQLEGICTGED